MEKQLKPRASVLTESDLQHLRELLAEHPCKYSFTPEQAVTLASFADNVSTAQKISIKVIITAVVTTLLGLVTVGVVQWIIKAVKTGAP